MADQRLWGRYALIVLAMVGLIGCAATFTNHGYSPTDVELEEITVGIDTRNSVETTIGRPTSTGVLNDGGWYYVSSKVKYFAYRDPEVIDRQLVAITFNTRGTVTNIERFTLQDGKVVALTRRVTDSGIRKVSFIGQLLSNMGRINLGDDL